MRGARVKRVVSRLFRILIVFPGRRFDLLEQVACGNRLLSESGFTVQICIVPPMGVEHQSLSGQCVRGRQNPDCDIPTNLCQVAYRWRGGLWGE